MLWFAFKFCIFDILLHLSYYLVRSVASCDLLSNFVSLIFCYICAVNGDWRNVVVICFQILYLWYSVTSYTLRTLLSSSCDLLSNFVSLIFCYICKCQVNPPFYVVICFQILYLWYSVASNRKSRLHRYRCDLLSNFVSLIFCCIYFLHFLRTSKVVICFQILYLWYSVASYIVLCPSLIWLWFAFKFCIFDILLHL